MSFTVLRCEEHPRPAPPTTDPLTEPTREIGEWSIWPWTLLGWDPEASRSAWNNPAITVWHFELGRPAVQSGPPTLVILSEGTGPEHGRCLLDECREWLAILDADPYAVRKDPPDLARFLLGTGVRIGEAMGVTWDDVDLSKQLVHIRRTVIRVKGVGLVPKVTKSRAGLRTPQERRQMSHSKTSMTQDRYMGRKVRATGAAAVLEVLGDV